MIIKGHMISMKEYCHVPRPMDIAGLIMEAVQKEDAINHAHVLDQRIPKLTYPKSSKWSQVASYSFFKQLLP